MQDTSEHYSVSSLMNLESDKLIEYLDKNFKAEIPVNIDSIDAMQHAGRLLGICTSNYSFLSSMAIRAKTIKRTLKKTGADKQNVDEALAREEIFSIYADIAKMTYNAVSRMITVKQQINDELHMTDGR